MDDARAGREPERIGANREPRHPRITARWLRDAVLAHRLAFEEEMRRERRVRGIDERFETYWRETSARHA
jgi:hypothetical protein